MGHEDQRHALAFVGTLDDLGHAHALVGHAAGQIAQHAGLVLDHDAHIVARTPFRGRHDAGAGQVVTDITGVVRVLVTGHGHEVGQHGPGGGQVARAAAVEEERAAGIAADAHGVVHAAHAGQQHRIGHQGREHARLQAHLAVGLAGVAAFAHLGDELDAVAELAGQGDVQAGHAADAAHGHGRVGVIDPVGQADEQGQLVGRIMAVDVQGGIGFGVAQLLGLFEGHIEVQAVGGHLGQDVVAGAVEDAHQGRDAVAGQAGAQGLHHGHGAGNTGLVAQDAALAGGLLEQGEPFLGQQGLVGGDDVLAGVQGAVDDGSRGVDAAHELHQHVDLGIVDQLVRIRGQVSSGRQGHGTRFLGIAHQHLLDLDVPARTLTDDAGVLFQQAGKTAAHGAEPGQTHYQRLVAFGHSIP